MRTTGPQWLLLCLLLLGVVGMHHFVPTPTHDIASVAPSIALGEPMQAPMHDPAAPAPAHELMHLCMAVLGAVLGLLLIALLIGVLRWDSQRIPSPASSAGRVDRPPGLSGRTLLASVCVLRL
jgi:hypothetical protein